MHRKSRLDRKSIARAIETDNRELTVAGLSLCSDLTRQLGRKSANLAHPTTMAAIVWKAGFDMSLTEFFQTWLAQLEPAAVPLSIESGGFPKTPDETGWHLELLEG